ncbi:MAG: extracellular solute-binding protein [Hyphomicrobiaceae bacterium]
MSAKATIAALLAVFAGIAGQPALATADERHGLSAFGDLKYPVDFAHFGYVNPQAPKGGLMVTMGTSGVLTFNSLNPFIAKGDAAAGSEELLFDSLMVRAFDEPDAVYGLLARSVEISDDGRAVTFHLRSEARFADQTPVTADDVCFSFEALKADGLPRIQGELQDVTACEIADPSTVTYRFKGDLVRDLPQRVALLPVLSRAYYATRKFGDSSLEPPLSSGPYAVGKVSPGTSISYLRRADYWAKDLPVNVGRYNFDEIRFEYYRDRTVGLQALTAGALDLREEFSSRDWATGYDVPAVKDGRIVRDVTPDRSPSGTQGFFFNTRRARFKDPRVREALDLAFDFEWTNKVLFYGAYKRTVSYFEGSPMKAEGLPTPGELALLEPYRDRLAPDVFGEAYLPPVTDGSGQNRANLRRAGRLLKEAGYVVKDGRLVDGASGEPFTLEFLLDEPSFERIVLPYIKSLQVLGIDAVIRTVDSSQYQQRLKSFDFDVLVQRYVMSLTPGPELRSFFGSRAARDFASYNLAGIEDPVVDALIEQVVGAGSRDALVDAARALDRVLRAGHYWVPQWYLDAHRLAWWDRFGRPEIAPPYDRGILDTWWYDTGKAAKLPRN